MSCTFADLQVVRYAEGLVASTPTLADLLTPAQLVKVGEIQALLDEIEAAGGITIDHELDCVKVALAEARDRIVP